MRLIFAVYQAQLMGHIGPALAHDLSDPSHALIFADHRVSGNTPLFSQLRIPVFCTAIGRISYDQIELTRDWLKPRTQ